MEKSQKWGWKLFFNTCVSRVIAKPDYYSLFKRSLYKTGIGIRNKTDHGRIYEMAKNTGSKACFDCVISSVIFFLEDV